MALKIPFINLRIAGSRNTERIQRIVLIVAFGVLFLLVINGYDFTPLAKLAEAMTPEAVWSWIKDFPNPNLAIPPRALSLLNLLVVALGVATIAGIILGRAAFWIGVIGTMFLVLVHGLVLTWNWRHHSINQKTLTVVVILVLVFFLPRYLHLLHMAARHFLQDLPLDPHIGSGRFTDALPSQRHTVSDLKEAVGIASDRPLRQGESLSPSKGDRQPLSIALRARWGVGKTANLRLFQESVESHGTGAVIWFDCWRHQTDPQYEFSLYLEAASTWSMLWPWGWTSVPVVRLYATLLPMVVKASLKFGNSTIEFDDKSLRDMPRASYWQRHLESLVRLRIIDRQRVVLILEDIDRCAAQAAQRYVTLIRRFLSVPGLSVVVPHVEEQFRPKVFDPFNTQISDLAATTEAMLWTWFRPAVLKDIQEDLALLKAPEGKQDGDAGPSSMNQALRPRLLLQYAAAPQPMQERILALLEDKYLADRIVIVRPLSAEDCAHLLLRQARSREALAAHVRDLDWQEAQKSVADALSREGVGKDAPGQAATARQFERAASLVLQEVTPRFSEMVDIVQSQEGRGQSAVLKVLSMLAIMAHDLAHLRTQVSAIERFQPAASAKGP